MTKIAFLGFTEDIAQRKELFSSLFGDAEIAFLSDLRSAVHFLVAKTENGTLDGSGNVAYIHRESEDVQKLTEVAAKVSLAIASLDQFDPSRSDEDVVEWLNNGHFPPVQPEPVITPEPEPVVATAEVQPEPFVDPLDALLDDPSFPLPVATVPEPEPQQVAPTPSNSLGSYEPDEEELANSASADDDIPLPEASYSQYSEPTNPVRRMEEPEPVVPTESLYNDIPASVPVQEPQVPTYRQPDYAVPETVTPEPAQQYALPNQSFDDLISPQVPQAPQANYAEPVPEAPVYRQEAIQPASNEFGIVAPSEVRQAMPNQIEDSVIDRAARQVEPEPAYREPEIPPYMAELEPQERDMQSILEEQMRMNPAPAADEFTGKREGRAYYVSGSHGGVGKTTVAYMLANVCARAIKSRHGEQLNRGEPPAEVWLVEADYRNPKLAHRLHLGSNQNSGKLARFLAEIDRKQSSTISNLPEVRANIIRECVYELPSGAKVVTCPYDITARETRFIQAAIQQVVQYAMSRGAHVFIDADTLSADDILDRKLATASNTIVMVADAGHIDDLQRSANTMMKRVSDGGMGIPPQRISVFLNRTPFSTFKELRESGVMSPVTIGGSIPRIEEWDTNWVGDQERAPNFLDAIAKYAVYALTFVSIPELKQWESYRTQDTPQRNKGFLGLFRKKPKVKSR